MKVYIASYGTRGDVQPYVALGIGLKNKGHEVIIGTSERFRDFIESNGLHYGFMADELLAIIDTDQGKALLDSSRTIFDLVKHNITLAKQVGPLQEKQFQETWEIAESFKPDVILYHPKAVAAQCAAEKLSIPCIHVTPLPMYVPTSERAFMLFPQFKLGAWYNRLSYGLVRFLTEKVLGKRIQKLKKALSLPNQKKFDLLENSAGESIPVIHAYSEAVLPRPKDWPKSAYVSGYCFLDREEGWQAPQSLVDFLQSGEAPIYIGFGSMAGRDPEKVGKIVIDALLATGLRGIIASGWGGMTAKDLPNSIYSIEKAPHAWLFSRVSAVVHHGGAGTTAAGLRAGKPTLITPFSLDQPFWGRRVYELGVGPKPIPQKKLTVQNLSSALLELSSNQAIRTRAAALGKQISEENGVAQAIKIIEKIVNKS